MTLLKSTGHAQIKLNGKEIIRIDGCELHKVIAKTIQELSNLTTTAKDFSTLVIKFSRRPIPVDDVEDEFAELLARNEVNFVDDSDLVPQLGITWGELNALNESQIWVNAFTLANTRNRENYTGDEIDSIRYNFKAQFEHTPYYKLLNGRL